MSQTTTLRAFPAWLLIAIPLVVLWRLAAMIWPSPYIVINPSVMFPLTLMGVMFLCSGVITYNRSPARATTVFALYCLGSATHWGGAVGLPPEALELALMGIYLAATLVAGAAFLHLALIYPAGRIALPWRVLLYAPAAVTAAAAPFAGLLSEAQMLQSTGALILLGALLTVGGAVVFVIRLLLMAPDERRQTGMVYIAAAIWLTGILQMLGAAGYLPGIADAWSLVLCLIPVVIAVALMSRAPLQSENSSG